MRGRPTATLRADERAGASAHISLASGHRSAVRSSARATAQSSISHRIGVRTKLITPARIMCDMRLMLMNNLMGA